MKILLIGSGGREHTLAWKILQSPLCTQLFIAPGNAGTAGICSVLDIAITNFEGLAEACIKNSIEMVVVGPEEPLVKGITDFFKSNKNTSHIAVIGPAKIPAQLEGSKAFAKAFMQRHHIPTASYQEFSEANYTQGVEYIANHSLPIVLKADGLAAGKGVLICNTHQDALTEFESMIQKAKFGEAGKKVVVEQFLKGIEMSVFALTDGKDYVLLPEAKDYKRIGEDDTGLNTGGMGAVSPLPFFDEKLKAKVIDKIVKPTIDGLYKENMDYKGFVFFGLMIDNGEPYVIEYNCRMGDPETEVVIPRLQNDLVQLLLAAGNGTLNNIEILTDKRSAVATVAVSGGYPEEYQKGKTISGLHSSLPSNCLLFHAGTARAGDKIVTNGGRVLVSTAFEDNINAASALSARVLEGITFEGIYYRKDIGYEFK